MTYTYDNPAAGDELAVHLKAARDIAAKAEAEGRDFTDAERPVVEEHLRQVKAIKARRDRLLADASLMKSVAEFGESIGLEAGGSPSLVAGRRGLRSDWGVKAVQAFMAGGTKALIAGGSVPVSVPLNPVPVVDGQQLQWLRSIIPTERDEVGRVSYLRQTARTNNAATVAEGALKPTSVYTLERVDDRTRTIAHLSEKIPRQTIADAPLLRQFVDSEMRYGYELEFEALIINGVDGVGEDWDGVLATSGTQSQAFDTDAFTTTRKAITQLEELHLPAGAFVMSPADWETIELLQDNDERYYMQSGGSPINRAARRLWGVPVVVTPAIATGTAIVGDWAGSSKVWIREEARLDMSEHNEDDFKKNLVLFRLEGRALFAVTRPLGFVEIDLAA